MSEIIDKNNERVIRFFKSLDHLLGGIEQLATNCKPSLNGEHFLTDREVSEKLKISRRTLQDYRTGGKYRLSTSEERYYIGKVTLRRC